MINEKRWEEEGMERRRKGGRGGEEGGERRREGREEVRGRRWEGGVLNGGEKKEW